MTGNQRSALPTLAILVGASVWGVVWYPLRLLAGQGLTGTAAGALTCFCSCLFVVVWRRRSLRTLRWHWLLLALGVASGITNLGFVWGTIHGQVLRVMLLFYLTPAWTAIYAHFLLRDRLTWAAAALAALSISGAMLMLWSPGLGLPLPSNPAEWAGLAAGLSFAMGNVLSVRISRDLPELRPEMRTATLFAGGAAFSFVAMFVEGLPPLPAPPALGIAAAIGVATALNNVLVQYGLARVPANRASIIMLFEIVVTALSAWLFAGELPGAREWAGGACIVAATLLSSRVHKGPAGDADGRDGARAMV
ncbi:DMT family transporter [Burkholderia plantarii]|uniref:DMT family transporter n=1 Tax=Burkholderia plantarii TaxID=41899 RepID=UPI0018DE4B24|nr:DMT family transporter [Burkholderia plantarii]MBI0328056.1 DMT family transporter [Burkholderia plantarii]